jgi:hypothetical protein
MVDVAIRIAAASGSDILIESPFLALKKRLSASAPIGLPRATVS